MIKRRINVRGPWGSLDILEDFGSSDPGSNPGGLITALFFL